jgi:ribonuclease Z
VVHRPGREEPVPAAGLAAPLALHGDLTIGPATAALRLGELAIEGWSRAGEETWFRVHPPGLGLDAGRGAAALVGARDLFLTHGHLDHALGVPWLLSQRRLQRMGPTRVFCPRPLANDLAAFVAAAERLEAVGYDHEIVALEAGDRVEVGRDLAVEAFAVDHVIPSLGFHLLRRRHHLRPELRAHDGAEIARLRERGVAVEELIEEVWLSYTGDTGAGVFASAPRLSESRVLLVECTFLGPALRARGADYGHLHLEDLAEHADRLAGCEAIVLFHLSRRHSRRELERAVELRLPTLAGRVHLLVPEAA